MNTSKRIKKLFAPIFAPYYKGRGHILMFHRVVPNSAGIRVHNTVNEITPSKLEELILFYKQADVDLISPNEIEQYLGQKKKYFVVFTFDDGFKDNYINALPIFEKYEVPFTVYITTGFIERLAFVWWYHLEEKILNNEEFTFQWGNQKLQVDCQTVQLKEYSFNTIRRIIIDTPYELQKKNIEQSFEHNVALSERLLMSWDDVIKLSNSPLVTIGAHTKNHPALNQLSTEDVIKECRECKEVLENKIKKKVEHFSYPFGSSKEIGERECEIVKSLGFKSGVTTRQGSIFSEHHQFMHRLPRIPITPFTSLNFIKSIINGKQNFVRGSRKRIITL